MGTIGHGYGSEWHLLRYLGYHRDYLQDAILPISGGNHIKWLDFQFSSENKALHLDREWQGIEFINDPAVQEKWSQFWPQTGSTQNWDAIGKLENDEGEEWLLVEAKAHIEEIHSSCGASSPKSKAMINDAFIATQESFGSKVQITNWLSPYYQFCNRLSVLHFLMRENKPHKSARLIFIYFYGDKNGNQECPQNAREWDSAIQEMYETVGLDKESDLYHRVHSIFLPTNPQINRSLRIIT